MGSPARRSARTQQAQPWVVLGAPACRSAHFLATIMRKTGQLLALLACLTLASAQMLGGFKKLDGAENDARVEAARGVAEQGLAQRLGAAPTRVEVLAAESQVVAGTNFKLTLKVDVAGKGVSYYEAKVWEKLPAHGGAMELTSLEEVSADQAGAGGSDEFAANPEVDDAAGFAVQELSSQSNSLFPFSLKKVLSAKVEKSSQGVTHHLRLQLSHGSMPDTVYEVAVANPGGSYSLLNSKQVMTD